MHHFELAVWMHLHKNSVILVVNMSFYNRQDQGHADEQGGGRRWSEGNNQYGGAVDWWGGGAAAVGLRGLYRTLELGGRWSPRTDKVLGKGALLGGPERVQAYRR